MRNADLIIMNAECGIQNADLIIMNAECGIQNFEVNFRDYLIKCVS